MLHRAHSFLRSCQADTGRGSCIPVKTTRRQRPVMVRPVAKNRPPRVNHFTVLLLSSTSSTSDFVMLRSARSTRMWWVFSASQRTLCWIIGVYTLLAVTYNPWLQHEAREARFHERSFTPVVPVPTGTNAQE